VEVEDVKDTFNLPENSVINQDIQPAAGEVWQITLFAKITTGAGADSLNLYLITDDGSSEQLDSSTGTNAQVSTTAAGGTVTISNDCYLRIRLQTTTDAGTRTVTYWYQAQKVSS